MGTILTTANLVPTKKSNILLKDPTPTIKEIQQVVAAGNRSLYEVGDWVVVDLTNFLVEKKISAKSIAGIGGKEYTQKVLEIPWFAIPGDDTPYLKLDDRVIEGTIVDFNRLPDELKAFQTLEEFQKAQDSLESDSRKVAEKAKKVIDTAKSKNVKESKGPMVRTDSQRI